MTPYPTKNFTATLDPGAANVTLVAADFAELELRALTYPEQPLLDVHRIEMIKQAPPERLPPVEYPNRKTRRRNAALARRAK